MALDGIVGQTRIAPLPAQREYLHLAIFLANGRVLDDRVFRLAGFNGQEAVSTPFEFQLDLRAETLEAGGDPLAFSDIIGRPVTFAIRRPNENDAAPLPGGTVKPFTSLLNGGAADHFSLFNGIATGFSMAEPGAYSLSVKAALWKLTLANRYEIHAQLNVRDTIKRLLDRHQVAHDLSALEGDDDPAVGRIQDWMQAGESDYAFLQRLMSKAHLYYYFIHGPAGHTVVFSNRASYRDLPLGRKLRYTHTSVEELGLHQDDVITQYSYQETLTASAVAGVFDRQENGWEKDPVAGFTSYKAAQPAVAGPLPFHQYKIFQYGCSDAEVARFTDATARSLAGARVQLSGGSRCDLFRTGYRFALDNPLGEECRPNPVRPSLKNRRFVLTQVQHQASLDGGYQNSFQATEESGLITPFNPENTHQGSMLGRVVGVGGKGSPAHWEYANPANFAYTTQSCTDKGGGTGLEATGVLVQFTTATGTSEPVFVKLAAHMQTVPEVGVTVLVSRANDESELPEVQSIVQANGSMVVMPSHWTANTHVGCSYSTAFSDSKSVRFRYGASVSPADVDAAEALVFGKYDGGQFRDASYSRGGSYSYSTSESGRGGMLSDSESFGNTYSRHQAEETRSWSDVGFSYSDSVVGTSENHSTVRQDSLGYQTIKGRSFNESFIGSAEELRTVEGDATSRSTVKGKSTSYSKVVGRSYNETTLGETESHTTSGSSSNSQVINGDSYSSSTVNGNSNSISTVTGTSSNSSTVTSQFQTSLTGVSVSTSATGMSNSDSVLGVNTSMSVIGLSHSVNVHGATTDVNAVGLSGRVNVTGASVDINLVGKTTSISFGGPGVDISFRQSFVCSSDPIKVSLPQALEMVL